MSYATLFEPMSDALAFGRIYPLFHGNKPDGYIYSRGEDIGINLKEGVKQLRVLADKGYGPAIHQLAMCYYDGKGVRKSLKEAFQYFEAAVQAGFAPSAGMLAVFFYGTNLADKVVPRDESKAFKLNEVAARAGAEGSMTNLANNYRSGMGTAPSEYYAYIWATLAVRCTPLPMRNYMAENLAREKAASLSAASLSAAEVEMTLLRQMMNPILVEQPNYWKYFANLTATHLPDPSRT
jgi:TPR repeat protein